MYLNTLGHLLIYLVSFLISGGIGLYAWRHRSVRGAAPYAIVAISQALWTLCFALELLTPTLRGKIFWDNIQFLWMFAIALALLAFALQYTQSPNQLNAQSWALLSIVPVISLLLVVTDPLHHLVRSNIWLQPGEPFPSLIYDFTPAFWVMTVYVYSLIIYSLYLLTKHYLNASGLYRAQVRSIVIGMFIPLAGATLTLLGINLTAQRDTTPITFALGNLFIAAGLFRYRLFDVVPVARELLIEKMRDAVIVLDAQGRVVDLNPAAQEEFRLPNDLIIGQPAAKVYRKMARYSR